MTRKILFATTLTLFNDQPNVLLFASAGTSIIICYYVLTRRPYPKFYLCLRDCLSELCLVFIEFFAFFIVKNDQSKDEDRDAVTMYVILLSMAIFLLHFIVLLYENIRIIFRCTKN